MTTPAEYRARAESLMQEADAFSPTDPHRVDLHRQATVYALLALGTEPAEVPPVTVESLDRALTQSAVGDVESLGSFADDAEPEPTKPAPRKRAAKKTTASKETSK